MNANQRLMSNPGETAGRIRGAFIRGSSDSRPLPRQNLSRAWVGERSVCEGRLSVDRPRPVNFLDDLSSRHLADSGRLL